MKVSMFYYAKNSVSSLTRSRLMNDPCINNIFYIAKNMYYSGWKAFAGSYYKNQWFNIFKATFLKESLVVKFSIIDNAMNLEDSIFYMIKTASEDEDRFKHIHF